MQALFQYNTQTEFTDDSNKQVKMLLIQHKQSSWIQTKQAGVQLYDDTFAYEVIEYSLTKITFQWNLGSNQDASYKISSPGLVGKGGDW